MKKEIQLTNKEIRRQGKVNRLNNLVLYGVQERGYERNIDTFYLICEFFYKLPWISSTRIPF